MSVDQTIIELSGTLAQLNRLVAHINGQISGITSRINLTLNNFDQAVANIAKDAGSVTYQVGDSVSQVPNSWVFYMLFITLIVVFILLSIILILNLITKVHAIVRIVSNKDGEAIGCLEGAFTPEMRLPEAIEHERMFFISQVTNGNNLPLRSLDKALQICFMTRQRAPHDEISTTMFLERSESALISTRDESRYDRSSRFNAAPYASFDQNSHYAVPTSNHISIPMEHEPRRVGLQRLRKDSADLEPRTYQRRGDEPVSHGPERNSPYARSLEV